MHFPRTVLGEELPHLGGYSTTQFWEPSPTNKWGCRRPAHFPQGETNSVMQSVLSSFTMGANSGLFPLRSSAQIFSLLPPASLPILPLRALPNKSFVLGVPIMAQWKQIRLVSIRTQVQSLALLSRLRIWCFYELWCRPAATVPIWPLAWEPLCVADVALKRPKKKKKNHFFLQSLPLICFNRTWPEIIYDFRK